MAIIQKKELSKKLAVFIKNKRKSLDLTQEDLAEITNMDYKHIQRLESFKIINDPRLSTIIKLASAFKIPLSEMLDFLVKGKKG